MVLRILLFGKNIILPNNSWFQRCFRSVKPVFYAIHALSIQLHAVVAIRCLAARAISPGARWCVVRVSISVSGCTPSPPSPRGGGKTGRLSGGGPCATTHSLLRLPAKHRPDRRSSQARRKFIASLSHWKRTERVFCVCSACILRSTFLTERSWQVVLKCTFFTYFQRNSIHYLVICIEFLLRFMLYYK